MTVEFIGNKKVVSMLERSLKKGLINHAYIFSGPEKVGKFTLAKMFAASTIKTKELNLNTDLEKDALLDLIEIRPEVVEKNNVTKKRDISIETIREVKLKLSLFPYNGKYKVLIVDDAHKMNVAAQNGLLKILEEPNATTIIILVTNELERILPTIISRAQMVNFQLVTEDEIEKVDELRSAANLAIGRPGLAIELASDSEKRNFRMEARNKLDKIIYGSLNEKFNLADELSKNIIETLEMMDIWIWELRKKTVNTSVEERIKLFAQVEKMQDAMTLLKRTNSNSKLILETLFMDLQK